MGAISQLFINGIQLDLLPDTVIAVTIQGYNPLIPNEVNYSFTNRITVPITVNNRNALNYLDNLASLSSFYKQRQPARFVQNGIEIIPDGYVLVLGIKENSFELAIYSGFLDLFSQLRDKLLIDIDYKDVNRGWTDADQDTFITGRMVAAGYGNDIGKVFTAVVNGGHNLVYAAPNVQISPAWALFGYKQMLHKILTQAGYTFDWGLLDDGVNFIQDIKFKWLALTQGNKSTLMNYSSRFKASVEFSAEYSGGDQVFTNIGNGVTAQVLFDTTKLPCVFWNVATASKYVVANADTALRYFDCQFICSAVVNIAGFAGSTCDVSIYLNGVAMVTQSLVVGTTTVSLNFHPGGGATIGLKNGDVIEVKVKQTSVNPVTITVKKGVELYNTGTMAAAEYVYFNEWLPEELTQLDIMKDFLFRFGQIPKQGNKKVTFRGLMEIINGSSVNPLAFNDWTNKRDLTKFDEVTFSLTELAQLNTYLYQISEDISSKYGSGSFTLDDLSLEKEADNTSVFVASADKIFSTIKCANIPVDNALSASQLDADIGARLLMARWSDGSSEGAIKVGTAAARNPYMVGCFTKASNSQYYEENLSYANVLAEKYSNVIGSNTGNGSFLERLKNARWVIRYYNLNDMDIATLDPHKMMLDSGQQFLFPKIFNYVPGAITKVLMLKI